MFAIKKSLRHCNQQMRILWSIKTVQLAQLNCFCHWLRVHIESCEVELASNRLQLPLMASLNDKISPLRLRRLGKTKSVLEECFCPTRTSQRMDSLDSHETLALVHIATPEAVTERVMSKV